jgi:Ca2+-binding RTX toxin-like protein
LNSLEDLAFNHEAEFTGSGQHLIATDERGGGVFPPGATCTPGGDNIDGNGGVHFYKTSALTTTRPQTADEAQQAYAKTPDGELAIYRARVRTKLEPVACTSHVFQQIPRENRIFMGWYSQGTQVFDFVEEANGRIRFQEAGWFIPEQANTWVSHIFKTETNPDGTVTYYGATGDFTLGEAGRNSIDVYKVTLPPAPKAGGADDGGGRCAQRIRGTSKRDKLTGSIAGDRIVGRRGNDRINARAGKDCAQGSAGNDRVRGGAGKDKLKGGRGSDSLKGDGGADKVSDRSGGRDRLAGGSGKDRLRSRGGGRDVVICGRGRDRAVVDPVDRVRGCERVIRG